MRRLAAALLAAAWLLGVPALLGAPSVRVTAHAQLVSSVPGAGERLGQPPAEIRLAFTERLEPLGSSFDLLDGEGRLVVRAVGEISPDDPRTLAAELPPLDAGLYTVAWRSLSADDGHTAIGFFTFGVGDVEVPGATDQTGVGIHAGHSIEHALLDSAARVAAQIGALLGFGLPLIVLAVAWPLDASAARRLGWWAGAALILSGLGSAALLPLNAESSGVDGVAYATGSDAGRLLLVRAFAGAMGGMGVLVAVARLRGAAWTLAALAAGIVVVGLLAASGHATTFGSLTPVVASGVHIGSAAIWLAGLVVLAWLAFGDGGSRRALVRPAIPRFSAVALPAVALFGLTGLYLWWLMLRQPLDLDNGYGFLLAVKLVGGVAAVAIGGINFLGWRRDGRLGEHRRVALESALALAVVVVTAVLVSGSPPGLTRPLVIERSTTSAIRELDAQLSLLPARPGPNRIRVALSQPPAASQSVQLVLNRVDAPGGTEVQLRPLGRDRVAFAADVRLTADSSWDATVRILDAGVEQGRARWTFTLGSAGLVAGRAEPPINPLLAVGALLAGLAVIAVLLVAARVSLPRTDRAVARVALLGGAAAAGALALLILLTSPLA